LGVGVLDETGVGSGEEVMVGWGEGSFESGIGFSAGFCPHAEKARVVVTTRKYREKPARGKGRIFLPCKVSELWQAIFVPGKGFVGHWFDFIQR